MGDQSDASRAREVEQLRAECDRLRASVSSLEQDAKITCEGKCHRCDGEIDPQGSWGWAMIGGRIGPARLNYRFILCSRCYLAVQDLITGTHNTSASSIELPLRRR